MKKHHTGLTAGYVGASNSTDTGLRLLQKAGNGELLNNEFPAILTKGELVLTEFQQSNINDTLLQRAFIPNITLSDYFHSGNIENRNISPVNIVHNTYFTLPNVTNNSGYERLQKELTQMQLDAIQLARKY